MSESAPQQVAKDIEALMRTEAGRRVFAWIIYDFAGVETNASAEGRREAGVALLSIVKNLTLEMYLAMIQERVGALLMQKEKRNARDTDDTF